jgi:hypothetical protein
MKTSFLTACSALLAITSLLLPTLGHAQTTEYFDGTGTWNTNPSNTDWNPGPQAWTNGNNAEFNQATNNVTVSGTVTENYIQIDGSVTSPMTISGGTIDQLAEDTTNNPTLLNDFSNASVAITSEIVLSDLGQGGLDVNNNNFQQAYINNYGSSNLSLGSIDWGAYTLDVNPPNDLNTSGQGTPTYDNHGALRILNIDAPVAGGSVTFTGNYTNDEYSANPNNTGSSINLGNGGDAGIYNISSTANFANFVKGGPDTNAIYLNSGVLNIDNSTFNGDTAPTTVYFDTEPTPQAVQPLEAWIGATANATAGYSTINLVHSQTIYMQAHINPAGNGTRGSDGADLTGATTIQQSGPGYSIWEGTPLVAGYAGSGGEIHQNGGNVAFGATTVDSRLEINSDVGGSAPAGLVFTGPGVVVLSNPTGNDYNQKDDQGNVQASSTVAATIEPGATVLIENSTGSAFGGTFDNYSQYSVYGNGSHDAPAGSPDQTTPNTDPNYASYQPLNVRGDYYKGTGINNKVILQAGATLGGTGISTNQIVAEGATSTITAGDPGQPGLVIPPKIGTLTLDGGGLVANDGLTLDFKIDGAGGGAPTPGTDNDLIFAGSLALNGLVTVNFTSLDGVATGTPYILMEGDLWSGSPTFHINAPTGYALDTSAFDDVRHGFDVTGYYFSDRNTVFEVQFVATPEPSTCAMMLIGAGALVLMARRKLT